MILLVQGCGDFDATTTEAVFEVPDNLNTKTLIQEFSNYAGLKPTLSDKDSTAATELLVEWLRKTKGYPQPKTKEISL